MRAALVFILVPCEIAIRSPRGDGTRLRRRGEWGVRWLSIGSSEKRLLIRWLRDALPKACIVVHTVIARLSVLETDEVRLLCWEGAGVRALWPDVLHLYGLRSLKHL